MVLRKKVLGGVMSFALMASMIGVAAADTGGLPGSGWFTSATIQNVTTANRDATVDLTVLPLEGMTGGPYTGSTTIAPGASKVFLPGSGNTATTVDLTTPLPANFVGSMVLSASEPVVAISQVGNNQVGALGTPGGRASAMYRGSAGETNILTYPTVKNSFGTPGKLTVFSIQAAGSDVTYNATIKSAAGGTFTKNGSISANRSVTLLPSDFGMPAGCAGDPNTAACLGSLTVQASGNIAGAVVETVAGVGVATQAQSTSLFSQADASDRLFCPVVKNDFDQNQHRFGGITVQNTGSAAATVNLELTGSGGAAPVGAKYTSSLSVPAGASRTFLATLGNLGGLPANSYASAVLTAQGGSIIASVNESNFLAPVNNQKATTYSCFAPARATGKVALPLVKEAFGATPATTGVSIQNVGIGAVTDVTLVYVCQGKAAQTVKTGRLESGAGVTFFLSPQVSDNSLCAVTATAANAATDRIVGIAQESSDPFGGNLDTKNYEGFSLQQ